MYASYRQKSNNSIIGYRQIPIFVISKLSHGMGFLLRREILPGPSLGLDGSLGGGGFRLAGTNSAEPGRDSIAKS
ncbi:MAG TPA: hypothetical protein ENL03_06220 [Phycisphaerae bacterium]|nr:hypothetical protein [Phycisphaerae bacterium]